MKNMEFCKESSHTFGARLELASRRKHHWLNNHYTATVRLTKAGGVKC